MKNRFIFIFIITTVIMLLTGCEKQICSYCGEEKYCEQYKILGTERYICKECMSNPEITTSSNVVSEYQAAPLEDSLFGIGSDRHNKQVSESDNEASSGAESSGDNSDNSSQTASLQAENTGDTGSETDTGSNKDNSSDNNSGNNSQNTSTQSSSYDSREDIVSRMAPLLASTGLQLSPSPDSKKVYSIINSDGTDAGITLTFDSNSNNKLCLNITKSSSGDNTAYTNTCISSALAFINSTDYNQIGYEIYNKACQYGNFTKNGCRFYYMDDSGNGSAEFDISFQ